MTISPFVRGGRSRVADTDDHAADKPTWSGSTPRSPSVHDSTGFFFAAMIPLNDGYRGSLIVSHTLTIAQPYDFDGDGHAGLVSGIDQATVSGEDWAGYVSVVPGSVHGPVRADGYILSQSSPGVPGSSEEHDRFGAQVASADLNADGYAELVVAAGGESGTHPWGGRITIMWGSASGLDGGTIVASPGAYVGMGGVDLEIADVTGDGHLDIVGGGEGDEESPITVAAGPHRPSGSEPAEFVRGATSFTWMSDLATGDFDGDGRTDVAASYSGLERSYTRLLRGTENGLEHADGWYDETIGSALAAGDLDGDGADDLVYGVARDGYVDSDTWEPEYPVPGGTGGTLRVLFGSPEGPAGDREPLDLSQETPGVPGGGAGQGEQEDRFGEGLAIGDANGDGHPDLAVGAPGEDVGGAGEAGAVTMLYGTTDGPGTAGARSFHQGTDGISGTNEDDDWLGESVRLRDVVGEGQADVITGVAGEDAGSTPDVGRMLTLPGGESGVSTRGAEAYGANRIGLPAPHAHLFLGRVLG